MDLKLSSPVDAGSHFSLCIKIFWRSKLATIFRGLLRRRELVNASCKCLGAVAVRTNNGASGNIDPNWDSLAKSLQNSTPHSWTRWPSSITHVRKRFAE
jgi:hypothetical protein